MQKAAASMRFEGTSACFLDPQITTNFVFNSELFDLFI